MISCSIGSMQQFVQKVLPDKDMFCCMLCKMVKLTSLQRYLSIANNRIEFLTALLIRLIEMHMA